MATPVSRYLIGSIPWYSALIVLGILLCYLLGRSEERRKGLPRDCMLDATLVAVPCGILGARIYYVLFSLDEFAGNWISVLYIWNGGIAIYGAVIGGALGVWVYARRKKVCFAALLDIIAPGLLLAQAIGRWGNYFNMEAYGPLVTDAAWQFFPFAVFIPADGGWHMATFFYESLWNALGFAALWAMRRRTKRDGDLMLWYVVIYGCGRFLIEQLRTDSLFWGALRVSQYLSLALLALACALWLIRLGRARRGRALAYGLIACAWCVVRLLLPVNAAYAWCCLALAALLAACGAFAVYPRLGDQGRYYWLALLFVEAAAAVMLLIAPGYGALLALEEVLRSVLIPCQMAFVYALLPADGPLTDASAARPATTDNGEGQNDAASDPTDAPDASPASLPEGESTPVPDTSPEPLSEEEPFPASDGAPEPDSTPEP